MQPARESIHLKNMYKCFSPLQKKAVNLVEETLQKVPAKYSV
jgi:hypothetical protein